MRNVVIIILFYILVGSITSLIIFTNKKPYPYFRLSVSDNQSSEVSQSTSSFSSQTNRNPFLSPMDYELIKKAEEEKRKKEELLKQIAEEQKKNASHKKKDDYPDFIKGIKLQGIVGKYAIINGDMVQEGYYYRKKILVEKVFSSYVIINYKGKKYKLIIK